MKVFKYTLFPLFLIMTSDSFAQKIRTKEDYLEVVKIFYHNLFSNISTNREQVKTLFFAEEVAEFEGYLLEEDCKKKHLNGIDCGKFIDKYNTNPKSGSVYFLKIKEQSKDLTQGLTEQEINRLLQDSSMFINNDTSSVVIAICFPNRKRIYFNLDRYIDEPIFIQGIYLTDGTSISNKMSAKKIHNNLRLLGRINDADGYVNVRKEANEKSMIVGKINMGERFYYTPNSNSSWWKIQKMNNPWDKPSITGYVF